MARKFGKGAKRAAAQPAQDPRNMFGPPPLPRQAGRPASSTPLADHLARGWPGVDSGYVVLPRSLAESMSLPWQQQMANLLAQFHEAHGRLSWPVYRVVPSRSERLVDLDEEQLAEAGYVVEIDAAGEMIYRERSGRKVDDPEATTVLVSCLDPIVRPPEQPATGFEVASRAQPPAPAPTQPRASPPQPAQGGAPPPAAASGELTSETGARQAPAASERTQPAPMNIGPQPVWHPVAPAGAPTPQPGPGPAQQPPTQPSAPSQQAPAGQGPHQPPAPQAQPPNTAEREADTPARGTPLPEPAPASERRWFDEQTQPPSEHLPEEAPFGPTGEPTEVPYRYRR